MTDTTDARAARLLADIRAERQLRITLERQRNVADTAADAAIAERDAALAAVARMGAEMEALRAALREIGEIHCGTKRAILFRVLESLDACAEVAEAALSAAPPPSAKENV